MKKLFFLVSITLAVFVSAASAQSTAQREVKSEKGWHIIADKTVDLKMDQDEVTVTGADKYRAIRLKATDADIEIIDIRVMYENEKVQDIEVRKVLKAGDKTKTLNLDGNDRSIKKIRMTYKTVPNSTREKAQMEIWGLR